MICTHTSRWSCYCNIRRASYTSFELFFSFSRSSCILKPRFFIFIIELYNNNNNNTLLGMSFRSLNIILKKKKSAVSWDRSLNRHSCLYFSLYQWLLTTVQYTWRLCTLPEINNNLITPVSHVRWRSSKHIIYPPETSYEFGCCVTAELLALSTVSNGLISPPDPAFPLNG